MNCKAINYVIINNEERTIRYFHKLSPVSEIFSYGTLLESMAGRWKVSTAMVSIFSYSKGRDRAIEPTQARSALWLSQWITEEACQRGETPLPPPLVCLQLPVPCWRICTRHDDAPQKRCKISTFLGKIVHKIISLPFAQE